MPLTFSEMCETLVEFAREHGWDELEACMDEAELKLEDEDVGSGPTGEDDDDDGEEDEEIH